MMDHAINGGGRGQGVFEDLIPLGEDQVGGDDHTAAFVPFGQEGEQYLHFLAALLNIADVIQDNHHKTIKPFELVFQFMVSFGPQERFHQLEGWGEQDLNIALDPFVSQGRGQMGFAGARLAKNEIFSA